MAAAMARETNATESTKRECAEGMDGQKSMGLLAEKLEQSLLVDNVRVLIGDKFIWCKQTVLAAYCELFATSLELGAAAKLSTAMTPTTFTLAYSWMTNELVSLLIAADYLGSRRLLFSILKAFDDARSCSATSGTDGLAQLLLPRVSESFLILVAAPVFRQLSAQCVCGLLGSNHVAVHSEIEVFYAAVIWLYDDYVNRIKHITSLPSAPLGGPSG
ncbi:actin-binding protein IPP [Drosophila madeirensis]|uniref:Actin-binding protein IPP n=1 Tax=Drosophila madeirensis TaxID=30013 RepID=A0AAU9FZR3_DROMD